VKPLRGTLEAAAPATARPEAPAEATRRQQALAADPEACAWVSANAGTGKTHVLSNRVLRLLLAGTAPERILALTYTKAAAAEMSKRVFQRLAEWARAGDPELTIKLTDLVGRAPSPAEELTARRLFARAIETPGGLKVETIHAFCERLLKRFPLEAGVSPAFKILDDQQRQRLVGRALDDMLAAATAQPSSPLWPALATAIAYAVDGNFERLLGEAMRSEAALALAAGGASLAAIEQGLRERCGVSAEATAASLLDDLAQVLSDTAMRGLAAALAAGGNGDQERAGDLGRAIAAPTPAQRVAALERLFLRQDKTPRTRLLSKEVATARPDAAAELTGAQEVFVALTQQQMGLSVVEATLALLTLSADALSRYRAAKARLAVLDFDDLIAEAARLLETSAAVEWVLYKLDGGLDHILVDEAQDTSPVQWQVVRALAGEFFSGEGARDTQRTLFAVGDEKQSIYGFQGAAPQMFAAAGRHFAGAARAANRTWRQIPLTVSFRSVEPLLNAVDRIFAVPAKTPGVGGAGTPVAHSVHRLGQAGLFEIWPVEKAAPPPSSQPWTPLAEAPSPHPVSRLAARIADTIKHWLTTGERLGSEDRPVRAGDILILVRKRLPFAPAMVSALKARRIAVAGADRLILTQEIAAQDLIALGDFMLLGDDDLALAALLKSPLFDVTDEELLPLAYGRPGPLWQALTAGAGTNARWQDVALRLARWQREARRLSPFEFYAAVIDRDGMRQRLLARLGSEAADPIDEFLNQALTYERAAPPSLQGFLDSLRRSPPQIKRDMEQGRDEVRVMTVHGAKGLEAPIVFLPDTCSTRSGRWPGSLLAAAAAGEAAPADVLWPVRGTSTATAVKTAREAEQQAEKGELDRLLYVALTRARDRLYVAGFEGTRDRPSDCWYNLISDGILDGARCLPRGDGQNVWRLEVEQTLPAAPAARRRTASPGTDPPPPWIGAPAPAVLGPVPLRPSQLQPLAAGAGAKPKAAAPEPTIPSPRAMLEGQRFLRGTLTHALFEHLPQLPPRARRAAAQAFLAQRAPMLAASTRAGIVAETMAVIEHPDFAPLFGPDSRAEVPVAARLARPGQPPLELTGTIDRLVRTDDWVLIVDYKTNRPPPRTVSEVAESYLLQLAAYRLAVARIFPGMHIRAALIWTDGARLMEIPPAVLSDHEARLWRSSGEP